MENFRVRFAPSPTGPLHIGGVRTALYNYLLAKKFEGSFILRIEDTDQLRYVTGAESYIKNALNWFGIQPDEGPDCGGPFGPYRQSERKDIYQTYVTKLIDSGHAYYAFDSPEDLDQMRLALKEKGIHSPKYDSSVRKEMKNSLRLSKEQVSAYLNKGKNITIRLRVPENEIISFHDLIRGEVQFNSNELDDKVLIKADGMPTYHLANVVDDHLMKISHVIRGEEWLSSTAHHVLLYRAFGWKDKMPDFAHLPLILKPSGNGKLSKRDGMKFGFPVFPLAWKDDANGESFTGFKEEGFLPESVLNFLVLLGWNPGTEQEMFNMAEMIGQFSIEHIGKSGARFDYDKAKWFNQHYIIQKDNHQLANLILDRLKESGVKKPLDFIERMCGLMKERVDTLNGFVFQTRYFFEAPHSYEPKTIRKRYKTENRKHFQQLAQSISLIEAYTAENIEACIKSYIVDNQLSFGAILPVLRIAISGIMKGPDIFELIELLGRDEFVLRLNKALLTFEDMISSN